jgi:hypothetical protein
MKQVFKILLLGIALSNTAFSQIKNLGPNVNSTNHEVRPVVSMDGSVIYFTVEESYGRDSKKGQDIWMSERDENGNWKKSERLPDYINSQRFNGVYWCSPDGNTLLVRGRYNQKDGSTYRGFSKIKRTDGQWGVPSPVIVKDYEKVSRGIYTGATLSPDQNVMIMYFSEERNNDLNDLWISKFDTATLEYSSPVKLGISEDDYDEISPYISPDGEYLFYSSDRPGGLGDFDIWVCKRLDDTWKNWSEPINLGAPFNTKRWDAYFSTGDNGLIGYVSNNTKYNLPGEMGGADIYCDTMPLFLRPKINVEMDKKELVKSDTIVLHDTVIITKIIPCDPLDTLSKEQLYKELAKGKILFDFGSSVLRSDAYKKLDVVSKLMKNNTSMTVELGGHTDAIGNDKRNVLQSEERALSARLYLIARGIDPRRISAKGYGNSKPIADNKTDAGRQLNRRVDITVITE